jgi:hypothetical protein
MAEAFAVGEVVRLVFLLSNPSLNGAIGTVVKDMNSRRRYGVQIQSPPAAVATHPLSISMNPLNLIKWTEGIPDCGQKGTKGTPDCDQKKPKVSSDSDQIGTKECSVCKKYYCSEKCQKENRKNHKIKCNPVTDLPERLGSLKENVIKLTKLTETLIPKLQKQKNIRLLKQLQEAATNLSNLSSTSCIIDGPESADINEAEEVEILAEEAFRIMKKMQRNGSGVSAVAFYSLLVILKLKKDYYGEKTQKLIEDHLRDAIRLQGMDGKNTAAAHMQLGSFHYEITHVLSDYDKKIKHLQLAKSFYKEAFRIFTSKKGPNTPVALGVALQLSEVSRELEQIGNIFSSQELL